MRERNWEEKKDWFLKESWVTLNSFFRLSVPSKHIEVKEALAWSQRT